MGRPRVVKGMPRGLPCADEGNVKPHRGNMIIVEATTAPPAAPHPLAPPPVPPPWPPRGWLAGEGGRQERASRGLLDGKPRQPGHVRGCRRLYRCVWVVCGCRVRARGSAAVTLLRPCRSLTYGRQNIRHKGVSLRSIRTSCCTLSPVSAQTGECVSEHPLSKPRSWDPASQLVRT